MQDGHAVLFDCENLVWMLTPEHLNRFQLLIDRDLPESVAVVRRAFADWSMPHLAPRQDVLTGSGYELVHVRTLVPGKNAADIALAVDALDLAVRNPGLRWFVIASGDSDFLPLVRMLRAWSRRVAIVGPKSPLSIAAGAAGALVISYEREPMIGQVGGPKSLSPAPSSTVGRTAEFAPKAAPLAPSAKATDEKLSLEQGPNIDQAAVGTPALAHADAKQERLHADQYLARLIVVERGGEMLLAELGSVIRSRDPGFSAKYHGFSKFSAFVRECPALRLVRQGDRDLVRLVQK